MTRWRARHRGTRSDRGAAAVEFAIVLVVLLLIIFGIIDFGRLLYAKQAISSASREGARTGVIATAVQSSVRTAVTNSGQAAASLAGGTLAINSNGTVLTGASAESTTKACGNPGTSYTVTVSTGFRWFTPVGIFSSGINSVSAATTMRCE